MTRTSGATSSALKLYLKALISEHLFVSLFRLNFHRITNRAYRSAQPMPHQLRRIIKKHGIATVVNLRAPRTPTAVQLLEEKVCTDTGTDLVYLRLVSRDVPRVDILRETRELLETIRYPALFHCTSGSDRAGLLSTLYLHWVEGIPVENTHQLRLWPFGHFRYAKTGMMDTFLEQYVEYNNRHPIELIDWAEKVNDRRKMKKDFKSNSMISFLVDRILRRQ